MKKLQQAQI